jgi:hypothetical protein
MRATLATARCRATRTASEGLIVPRAGDKAPPADGLSLTPGPQGFHRSQPREADQTREAMVLAAELGPPYRNCQQRLTPRALWRRLVNSV